MRLVATLLIFIILPWVNSRAESLAILPDDGLPALTPAPTHVGGRVIKRNEEAVDRYRFQWPGVYFECAFDGSEACFDLGVGQAIYHVIVDGALQPPLVKPKPGRYRVWGLSVGKHTIRIEVVTESSTSNVFAGFFLGPHTRPVAVHARPRQIECIGDSYMVGYGNTSYTRDCTPEQVWARTDTSSSFPVLLAKYYNADYQVNAASGRGIVRNYDGFGPTLPQLYPKICFDEKDHWSDPQWQPQIVWIDLGSNDFATPLHPTEKWKMQDDLQADFQRTYLAFVHQLRAQRPNAFFILSASVKECEVEVKDVVEKLKALGEKRVGYVRFPELTLEGCNWHLTVDDDEKVMAKVVTYIDREIEGVW